LWVTISVVMPRLALQLAQLGTQVLAHPGIQGRHRLIEQQQRRRRRQGTGQGDPLLLAAGQLAGEFLFAAGQAHQFQHLATRLRTTSRLLPASP
jgi:hypothetical protein